MSVVSCRLRLWASTIERLLKQRTLIGTTESVCVRTGFISLRWEKTAEIALIQPRSGGMKLARGVTPGSVGKSRSRGRGVRVLTQTLTPCPDTKQIKAEFPALYWAAMWSRPLFSAFVWLTLLLPLTATAQAPSGDKTPQTTNSATGIPTFYANSRQVIVEAEVWDKTRKNGDDSGIDPALPPAERAALRLVPPPTQDTAYWSPADQTRLASVAGISRIEFRRTRQLLLDAARPPVTLITRDSTPARVVEDLPLVRSLPLPSRENAEPAWISEELQDLYGYKLGVTIDLPLAGQMRRFTIAGIWRDYARAFGAVVITRTAYIEATGDRSANEGSIWLNGHTSSAAAEAALRACFTRADSPGVASPGEASLEILTSTALRERSLQIFDRAFAITYALEAIAVIIGLTGISFAASSTALARRAEFGMLRHVGMLRKQVIGMLASEGVLMSVFGVVYGLILGAALSLVLVYVVNRQSFNWSIDFALPAWQLVVFSVALIAAAAITAIWSGRAAMNQDAVRAVREDW